MMHLNNTQLIKVASEELCGKDFLSG